MAHQISVIPGDGIGPEVVSAVKPLLDEVAAEEGFELEYTDYDWGTERYLEEGAMMPDDALDQIVDDDAILLGAVGHPDVPDHITLHGLLLPIRKQFNQQVCKRPSILYEGVESPLRGYESGDIDFVVFRENTEGEYADIGGRTHQGFDHEVAVQSAVYTREATETIIRAAFEEATEREGHVTSITKSNAQAFGMVFWDDVVAEVSEDYPDVEVESLLIDAASMDFVRRPHEFDVVVASNLFGDILTDIGAIVSGSMGLAPSANINVDDKYPSMFEPVHGSAPDIVGQGVANPIATVLSAAMMFDNLGEATAAERLEGAVESLLADSTAPKTPDLGGDGTTESVVAALSDRL
ncbi:MAG: isocitrate/isopropylmalate family dehydrogenase [Natronomonas sp.]